MKKEAYRALDLFAGVGGIKLGFEKAGFKTVFANDFEEKCKPTYDLNSSSIKLNTEDINKLNINELPEFDILLGGFPCQSFSIAGYRKGFKDKGRGDLFFKIYDIISEKRPEVVFLENVKNLENHDKGRTFKIIFDTLEMLGYKIKHKVLNSMMHGNIPQNRERIFIIGFLDHKKADLFNFPEEVILTKSFKDFLEKEIPDKYYYLGKPLHDKIKKEIISKDKVYQWRRKYVRENKKGVVPTLTANMGMGGHNVPIIRDEKGIRKLTPKECFNLQGFPENFKLPNLADSVLYKQAGNSVTVKVIEKIAKNIKIALNS